VRNTLATREQALVRRDNTTGFAQGLLFVLLALGGVAHTDGPIHAKPTLN